MKVAAARVRLWSPIMTVRKSADGLGFSGVAAATIPDRGKEFLSRYTLESLVDSVLGLHLLPDHFARPGEELGRVEKSWLQDVEEWALLWVAGPLFPGVAQAVNLHDRMQEGDRYQLSIDGTCTDWDYIWQDDGSAMRRLNNLYPDHVCATRFGKAANPLTWLGTEGEMDADELEQFKRLVSGLAAVYDEVGEPIVKECSVVTDDSTRHHGGEPTRSVFGHVVRRSDRVVRGGVERALTAASGLHVSKEVAGDVAELLSLADHAGVHVDEAERARLAREATTEAPAEAEAPEQTQEGDATMGETAKPDAPKPDTTSELMGQLTAALDGLGRKLDAMTELLPKPEPPPDPLAVLTEKYGQLAGQMEELQKLFGEKAGATDGAAGVEGDGQAGGDTGAQQKPAQGDAGAQTDGSAAQPQTQPDGANQGAGDKAAEDDSEPDGYYAIGVSPVDGEAGGHSDPIAVSKEDFDVSRVGRVGDAVERATELLATGDTTAAKALLLAQFVQV